jgi:MraZ protein
MFHGIHYRALDAKRRVTIPRPFVSTLGGLEAGRDQAPSLFLLPLPDGCIGAYDPSSDAFADFRGGLDASPFANEKARRLQRLIFSRAMAVSMDRSGRITLPPKLYEHAGLTDAHHAVVLGAGSRFEIWSKTRLEATWTQVPETMESPVMDSLAISAWGPEGRLKLHAVAPDAPAMVASGPNGGSPSLFVPREALDEFQKLLDADDLERCFQKLFEAYPEILLGSDHVLSMPSFGFRTPRGRRREMDFILAPAARRHPWQVVELKRPSAPLVVGQPGRERPHHRVLEAVRQAIEYCDWLKDPSVRAAVETRSGQKLYAAEPVVIIGRNPAPHRFESVNETLERFTHAKVWTFDDLFERAQRRQL